MTETPEDRPIIKRAEAKMLGQMRYFTGRPCKHGHISERFVSNLACAACLVVSSERWHGANKEKIRASGIDRYLRDRKKIAARKAAKYAESPEKHRAKSAAWNANNPVRARERHKKRRAEKADVIRIQKLKYRAENKDRARVVLKLWRAANREKVLANNRNRAARRRCAEGFHTAADIISLRAMQKDKCAYCRIKLNGKGEVDHIIALSKGGSNWPRNLQFLCRQCNGSKTNKHPVTFAQERGLLL